VTTAAGVDTSLRSRDEAATLERESHRRGDVQGLRAIAILAVVAYHAGLSAPGGFTGVDVFFAISGFVITGTLLRQLVAADTLSLGGFYLRRIKRLLPAFATMVLVVSAIGVLACPAAAERLGALTGAAASVFAANVYLWHVGFGYFDVSTSLDPFLHTWTLGVEEQFYLVFPALLVAVWWAARRRLRLSVDATRLVAAFVLVLASVVSFVVAVKLSAGILGGTLPRQKFAFYGSPTRAWEFGAGAVVALLVPWVRRIPPLVATAAGAAGIAAITVGVWHIHGTSHTPGVSTLLPVAGTCAAILCGTAQGYAVPRVLALAPLAWIGDLSYSWYLWHWPAIVYAHALAPTAAHAGVWAGALSLVPAWLSFRYVENPIRFRLRAAARPVLALGAACVALSLVGVAALWGSGKAIGAGSTLARWQAAQRPHVDQTRGCADAVPYGNEPKRCDWRVAGARGEVVLLGDSNAGHFAEPVIAASGAAHLDAVVTTAHGCPFAFVRILGTPTKPDACLRYVDGSVRAVLARRPSLVFVAERTDEYLDDSSWGMTAPAGGTPQYGSTEKARLLERGLAEALRPLSAAHIPVVLVHPIPALPVPSTQCAVVVVLLHACASSVSRSHVDRELAPAVALETRALASAPSARGVSFESEICGRSTCRSTRGSTLLYWDNLHLSVEGAMTLVPRFETLISSWARIGARRG
jgi:peptidoglycan/LPS O-acetylase OafA/YrhL